MTAEEKLKKKIEKWEAIHEQIGNLSDKDAAGVARYVAGYLRGNPLAYKAFTAALRGVSR